MNPYRTAPMPPASPRRIRTAHLAALFALVLSGCTAAQGRVLVPALETVGEALCEAFVPILVPGLGAADVLGCKSLEALIAGAVAAGTTTPAAPAVTPSGGGAGFNPTPEARKPLRVRGQVVAIMPAGTDSTKAHAFVAAHPELWAAR